MKRRIVWLLVSCLMVAALLMASCAPAEEEMVVTPKVEEKRIWRGTKLDGTVVEKVLETPTYGGVFVLGSISATGPLIFDNV